jgi:hypothetical protein
MNSKSGFWYAMNTGFTVRNINFSTVQNINFTLSIYRAAS